MISRRRFLALLGAAVLAAPLAAEAQQVEKIARVGVLVFGPANMSRPKERPIPRAMEEFGWVEGRNMVVEWRRGGSADELHEVAAELVRLKVDVLIVPSCGLAKIVQNETSTIPIVVWSCGYDLVTVGLAANLARPGGNITGLQVRNADLVPKRIELLKELVPNLLRVATLSERVTVREVNPAGSQSYADAAVLAARTLRIELDAFYARSPDDFPAVFRGMAKKGDRGLLLYGSPFMDAHGKQIIDLAATHRIPVIYETKGWVRGGGLMSYGPDYSGMWRQVAVYVDKILKGAKPGDLPIGQPTTFELAINLKTAKALGLTIPRSLLSIADEVIQ